MTSKRARKRGFWFGLVALLLAVTLAACDNNAGNDGNVEPYEIQPVPGGGAEIGRAPGPGSEPVYTEDEDAEIDAGTEPGSGDATQPGQEGEQEGDRAALPDEAACAGTASHPIAEAIAADFPEGAGYDEIMARTCEGHSFKDILLALQTGELTGRPAADLLAAAGQDGWQQVWQQAELGADPCAEGEAEHSLAAAITRTYNGDYGQVVTWRCDEGLGFGEIMLALQTAGLAGEAPATLIERRLAGDAWAEIWQELNVIDQPAGAGPPAEELSDG